MVEYALLVAGSLRVMADRITATAVDLDWRLLGLVALAALSLRIAIGAFGRRW